MRRKKLTEVKCKNIENMYEPATVEQYRYGGEKKISYSLDVDCVWLENVHILAARFLSVNVVDCKYIKYIYSLRLSWMVLSFAATPVSFVCVFNDKSENEK